MSSDSYRRAAQRHRTEIAKLQNEKGSQATKAAEETKRSASAEDAARRTTSASKLADSQRHAQRAAGYQRKVAEIEGKIAREQGRLNDALKRLANSETNDQRRRTQDSERAARASAQRISAISCTLAKHQEFHEVTRAALERLESVPNTITVLFLAANPLDLESLRLDEEARSIAEMLRKSKYRDSIRFESRWAVRPLDLLQAINELHPTVVHFSGHGSDQDEIVFQDSSGNMKSVSKEAIVQTMAAASDTIQLVFFNACFSKGQAAAVVEHVPAAIGMNASISDEAALTFAAQFYSAIGFGLSVGRAFAQSKAAMMLEGYAEETVPELFVSEELLLEQLVLVVPNEPGSERAKPD